VRPLPHDKRTTHSGKSRRSYTKIKNRTGWNLWYIWTSNIKRPQVRTWRDVWWNTQDHTEWIKRSCQRFGTSEEQSITVGVVTITVESRRWQCESAWVPSPPKRLAPFFKTKGNLIALKISIVWWQPCILIIILRSGDCL
jgi:hypothetical protein